MFDWLRKIRIKRLARAAEAYVSAKYTEPQQDDSSASSIRYSLSDNYNSGSVKQAMQKLSSGTSTSSTLKELDESVNMSFVNKMLEHIRERSLNIPDVYKAAQVDRRLFSKIVSDTTYKPAKDTCVALCLAMKLTLSEANDLLSRAGYTLSHSDKRDIILEYFFRERIFDINYVNDVLFCLEQKTLGR